MVELVVGATLVETATDGSQGGGVHDTKLEAHEPGAVGWGLLGAGPLPDVERQPVREDACSGMSAASACVLDSIPDDSATGCGDLTSRPPEQAMPRGSHARASGTDAQ